MKKKIVIILVIFAILGLSWAKVVDNKRYTISAPMMDIEYKKAIIRGSRDKSYTLENLRPLVGQEELIQLIQANDDNPQIYTPSEKNIKTGEFAINLHMHTIYSDGKMSTRKLLDKAQEYAKDFPEGKYMYIALTDHNTVLGVQNLILTLQKNPNRYTKIKIIPGMEIFTKFSSQYANRPIDIHVLTWCINPYDKFLNKEFYKKDLSDTYNNHKNRDFDEFIAVMSKHGIVGVAHPARYVTFLKEDKYLYMKEMFTRYKTASNAPALFTEGYYQTYPLLPEKDDLGDEYDKFLNYINDTAKEFGIIRTGSTDTHGYSIFRK